MRLALICGLLMMVGGAGVARAEIGIQVQALVGVDGSDEGDKLSCRVGCNGSVNLSDEDLRKNYGFSASYEYKLRPRFHIGGRLAYLTGKGHDSDAKLSTYDVGGWARYLFPVKKGIDLYAGAALGPTYWSMKAPVQGESYTFTGLGLHALGGFGIAVKLNTQMSFVGGIYYSYQMTSSIEAEKNFNGGPVRLEMEDVDAGRFLVAAGLAF